MSGKTDISTERQTDSYIKRKQTVRSVKSCQIDQQNACYPSKRGASENNVIGLIDIVSNDALRQTDKLTDRHLNREGENKQLDL